MAQSPADASGAGLSAAVLARVPGCERGEAPLAIEPLAAGSGHRGVRVRTRLGEYVVRSPRTGVRSPEACEREGVLQNIAAAAGLAPELIWTDARTVITRYVEGRVWSTADMGDADRIDDLGHYLRRVHALPAPELACFDALAAAEKYRVSIPTADACEAAALDARLDEIRTIALELASRPRAPAIIHGDVHHTNVVDGERLVLIDWEYAAVSDPLFDLGCVLAYYPAARPHAARLLDAAALADTATAGMLSQACRLYEHLSELWSRAVAFSPACGARAAESAD